MVKTLAADGTMLETAWESRWLPDIIKKKMHLENYTFKNLKHDMLRDIEEKDETKHINSRHPRRM